MHLIHPSSWETFGIRILEAMAVGPPVVASKLDGTPELGIDGENGILVEPGNEKSLA